MKKRAVVFAPEARNDLMALYDWIESRAGPVVALGYLERLEVHCLSFDFAAERGRRRDDIREGLRIVGFERRVTIAFTVADDEVTILRVFAGGQAWETQMQ